MKLLWFYTILLIQASGATPEILKELKRMAQGGAAPPEQSFMRLFGDKQGFSLAPGSETKEIVDEACRLLRDRRTDVQARALYVVLATQIKPNPDPGVQEQSCLDSLILIGSDKSNPNRTSALSIMSYLRPRPKRLVPFYRQQLTEKQNNADDLTFIFAVLLDARDEALTTAVIEHAKTVPPKLYAMSNVMRILAILGRHDAAGLGFIRESLDSADEATRHEAIVAVSRMSFNEKPVFAERMRKIRTDTAESERNRSEAREALK